MLTDIDARSIIEEFVRAFNLSRHMHETSGDDHRRRYELTQADNNLKNAVNNAELWMKIQDRHKPDYTYTELRGVDSLFSINDSKGFALAIVESRVFADNILRALERAKHKAAEKTLLQMRDYFESDGQEQRVIEVNTLLEDLKRMRDTKEAERSNKTGAFLGG